MTKQLTSAALATLLLFVALTACASDTPAVNQTSANYQDALKIFECVKPDISSYWRGEGAAGQDDFVVVYSMQGFIADIENRLPASIVKAVRDASTQAISRNKISLTARDMAPLTADFYNQLQIELAKLAKLPEEACGVQAHRLVTIFNTRYHFSMQGSQMDEWYVVNHVNELNVKNDEFLALFAKGSEIKGTCRVVSDDGSRRVTVCK